jgi:hypothetical protein
VLKEAHHLVDDLNGTPSIDSTGDVDLSLIDFQLSLTPAQRLSAAEEFANWILNFQKSQGRDWLRFVNSSSV